MATPKKLPSGNWRVRVYVYTDESNVRHYRSFTAATRKDCAYMAAEFAQNKARIAAGDLTVAEAIDDYIRVKSEVLSPSTIRGYKKQRRNYYMSIEGLRIRTLTTPIIQEWINRLSGKLSPKTVANIHVYFVKCFSQKSERKIPNLRNGIFPYISRKHFHMIVMQSVA